MNIILAINEITILGVVRLPLIIQIKINGRITAIPQRPTSAPDVRQPPLIKSPLKTKSTTNRKSGKKKDIVAIGQFMGSLYQLLPNGLVFRFGLEQIRGGLEEKAMVLRRHDGYFSVLTPIS